MRMDSRIQASGTDTGKKAVLIDEELFTMGEAGKILRVSKKTISEWVNDGSLGCYRLSTRKILISSRHIRVFLESKERKAPREVDIPPGNRIPSHPRKGGEESSGFSSVDLRKEMKQWQ